MKKPASPVAISPVYAHTQNALLDILTSELAPGDKVPVQHQLADRCGASRTTVYRILDSLKNSGLLAKAGGGMVLQRRPTRSDFLPQPRVLSRREAVEQSLTEMLLEGRLKPGERFAELTLARLLHVTTGTIREALLRLSRLGVFVKSARKQWSVTSIDAAMINELMDVRVLVETFAMRRYFRNPTPERHAVFAQILEATSRLAASPRPDRQAFFRLDRELHGAILASAANRYLAENFQFISFPIQIQLLHHRFDRELQDLGTAQHIDILRAITEGREREAMARVEKHLDLARDTLLRLSQ